MKNNKNKIGFLAKIKVSKYYEAVEAGFWRIWKNKTIWFWGLFISIGTAFNFNQKNKDSDPVSKEVISDFFSDYWQWLLLGIIVVLILTIIIWLISTVARVGVIEELNKKQNNKKHILGFKKIWQVGKGKFKKIFNLDLVMLGAILLVFSVVLIVAIPLFLFENKIFFGLIFGVIVFISFLFLVGMAILKPFVQIVLLLGDLSIKDSFLRSWKIIRNNFKEFFRLCLTCFGLSLIKGLLLMLVLILMAILGLFSYLLSLRFNLGLSTDAVIFYIAIVLVVVFLVVVFVLSAFFALWKMDILIWWTKMIDGVKSEDKTIEEKEVKNRKVIVGKKVAIGVGA